MAGTPRQDVLQTNSLRWMVTLIQKLCDIAWDMCEHRNKAKHIIVIY